MISDQSEVRAVLADPAFVPPPVPPVESPIGIAWLRAHVGRFSGGAEHERRRALGLAELARIDPAALRRDACARASMESLRAVPVETLAAALGLPAGLAADVAVAARVYQPHAEGDTAAADRAVARLVAVCGGVADELTAARIGLLVQACDATADLVERAAASLDAPLEDVLRDDPPVRATRRVAPEGARVGSREIEAGTVITLDLTSLPFGSGLRPCPGREHALALAAGVLDAVRNRRTP